MRASGTAQSLLCAVLCFLLAVAVACGDGPGPDPDPPENNAPNASASANTTSAIVGDTIRLDASGSSDPDGDKLSFSWTLDRPSGSNATMSSPTAARPWFVPDTATTSNEDYSAEVEVTEDTEDGLSDTDHVTVTAQKQLPQTVTVPVENVAADGDSLITETVTWEDSVVAEDVRSAEVAVPASRDEGRICTKESDLFHASCKTLTPTSDISETQSISVQRKTVTYTIDPEVPYGDHSAVDVSVSGSQVFTGSGSVDVPKLSADKSRVVSGNLITEDQDNSSKVDRLYADTTVSSFENIDLTVSLEKLPACSDGIDNDGDGVVDENDTRACTDLGGNYDPQDDNEILKRLTSVIGRYFDDSTFVSAKKGYRTAKISSANNPLPWSVTVAKGEIKHAIEMQMADSIPGQDHATHLKTGASNDNLTVEKTSDVVADADTTNGFIWKRVHGIDRSFFADGPHYAVYGWHGSKAHGGPPSSGGKFYYYAELESDRLHSWSYTYEPEDVPDDKAKLISSAASTQSATLEPGECMRISPTDEVCRVPAGKQKQTPAPFKQGVKRR
jgi:hypothetical protein